jgi:hypothetical protein
MSSRRQFIQSLTAVGLGVAAGASMLVGERDEYLIFLANVRSKVIEVVRREGRGFKSMEIAPPQVVDGLIIRRVSLGLNAGPTLLDKLYFTWDEPWYGLLS